MTGQRPTWTPPAAEVLLTDVRVRGGTGATELIVDGVAVLRMVWPVDAEGRPDPVAAAGALRLLTAWLGGAGAAAVWRS